MQQQLERDLKNALLSGDKVKSEVIKSLKNALQYEAVRLHVAVADLTDQQMAEVLAKEAKKRQEAADAYKQGGESQRADSELGEKTIIDAYLPDRLNEEEINEVVAEEISKLDNPGPKDLGIVIHAVKQKLQTKAEGSVIAKLAKDQLEIK